MSTKNGDKKAMRQCWECLKRRLVCDLTLPSCEKCIKAGRSCPGYNNKKPVQWIQTGQVTSKQKKKNAPPIRYNVVHRGKDAPVRTTDRGLPKSVVTDEVEAPGNEILLEIISSKWASKKMPWTHYISKSFSAHELELCYKQVHSLLDVTFRQGKRRVIEDMVERGLQGDAQTMLPHVPNALKALEYILGFVRSNDVPVYHGLVPETSDVVQAIHYINAIVIPPAKAAGVLAPNAAFVQIHPSVLYLLSPAIHHTMVCIALSHFIQACPFRGDRTVLADPRSRLLQHRGNALRALCENIAKDKTRSNDVTICSILMFMAMEIQNVTSANWRSHAEGLTRIIGLRGGYRHLMAKSPYLLSTLVVYLIIVTFANTCSPPREQIVVDANTDALIEGIEKVYDVIFPYILCPRPFFIDIIRINRVRALIASAPLRVSEFSRIAQEARVTLDRIESFVPEEWAKQDEYHEEWVTVGQMYQSATAIYCIMSMQDLNVFLHDDIDLVISRNIHGDSLLASLAVAMQSPRLVKFIMWPLVVAGVEAAYRGQAVHRWIEERLVEASCDMGFSSPLKARSVFRRYWREAIPGWNKCFGRAEDIVVAAGLC